MYKIARGSTVTLPYFCWYLAAISWRCLFVRAPRTATIASLSLPVGWKKEDFKLSKLHHKSRLSITYQPRPMKLTRRPWLFRISQKPNPTIVYFSSPDPAMAFLSASASFPGSKLSAGFNVPWNSAWKKEFEMHKKRYKLLYARPTLQWGEYCIRESTSKPTCYSGYQRSFILLCGGSWSATKHKQSSFREVITLKHLF